MDRRILAIRLLCSAPLLVALYYVLAAPRVHYTTRVSLRAPDGAQELIYPEVQLEQRDRALALLPGKGVAGPRIVVRNNIKSADLYHQLMHMERSGRVELRALLPDAKGGDAVLAQDTWQVSIDVSSDYGQKVVSRLWALLLGLAVLASGVVLAPRLVRPSRPLL